MKHECVQCGFRCAIKAYPHHCRCGAIYQSDVAPPVINNEPKLARKPTKAEIAEWKRKPGCILEATLKEIGAKAHAGCGCVNMVRQMNFWGIDGCRAHRDEIAEFLKANAAKLKLLQVVCMVGKAATVSWSREVNPLDPFGSLVDIAVRRAEAATLDLGHSLGACPSH